MLKLENTCYKCEERVAGCHSVCERYIEAKERYEAERQRIKKLRDLDWDSKSFHSENVKRTLKSVGKKI